MSKINQEIWKDIPNYEGLYQASNLGRIKSFWFWSNRTNQRYYREKILKPKFTKDGCSRVELWRGGEHKTYLTYRLELCAFTNKPYEYEMTVNHKDGNRLNNNLENLEWLSLADNVRHAFENDLMPYKKLELIDKKTNQVVCCGSMSKISEFMGYNQGYVSCKINRGKWENGNFKWKYKEN